MLRVTPLYGSRWDNSGVSRSGSCTLVEYADIKVLVDVGIRNNNNNNDNNNNNTQNKIGNGDNNDDNNNNTSINTSNTASKSSESFWENLPPHDCLVLTDSTLESIGSLPLYVEGIRRAAKKRRHNRLVEIRLRNRRRRSSIQKQQQQQANRRRSSSNAANFQHEEEELLLDNDDNDDDKDYMDIVPPIFATFPTVKMGQMSLYDYHANISLDGCKPSFTLEEMDRSISLIRTIKYSQTLSLPFPLMEAPPSPFVSKTINNNNNKDEGKSTSNKPRLAITAHMAGHVVGGAFYKFVRLRDETSVVITHVYHIARELHLDAATLLRDGSGVDVLITYPGGSASCPLINTLYSSNSSKTNSSNNNKKIKQSIMKSPLVSKVRRDITERILGLLRRDANVLLPVDASGRSLELVLLLDRFWSHNNLSNTFNLVWFGPMVHNTLEFTRSQLEWMNSVLSANIFDHSQNNKKGGRRKNRFSQDKTGGGTEQGGDGDFDRGGHPYALRNVKLCTNMVELEKMISSSNDNPTCVLANGLSLDHGKYYFYCTVLSILYAINHAHRSQKGHQTSHQNKITNLFSFSK
jgi:Cft2 family RNA processing exonuclease